MTTRDIIAQTFTIISGDEINMTIKKATTRVDFPPKRKHVNTLSQYLSNPRANFIHLIDCLTLRFRKKNWMISMKALLTAHYLMNQNNQSFMAHISKRTSAFEISGYIDNSSAIAVDMSYRVTSYAKFLSCKSEIFRVFTTDLTLPANNKFSINNIKEIFHQIEYLEKLSNLLHDNNIDFCLTSSILRAVHIILFKEYLRIFSAFNSRLIFLLENLGDMEASDAVQVLPHYQSLIIHHDYIIGLISLSKSRGVEGVGDIKLATPSQDLMKSIEEFVRDIIRIRGTPRLQKEWNVVPHETAVELTKRGTVVATEIGTDKIPSSLFNDLDIFSSLNSVNREPPTRSTSVEVTAHPMICDPYDFNDAPRQIGYDKPQIQARPTIEEKYSPAVVYENQKKPASKIESMSELDQLIFSNVKMDSIYGAPPNAYMTNISGMNQGSNYPPKHSNYYSNRENNFDNIQRNNNTNNPFL